MIDRLWHKTLLRCLRESTGINRTRDQRGHYRETTTSDISYKELSPQNFWRKTECDMLFGSYCNPDERVLLSLLHFRPNRCWSTLWYMFSWFLMFSAKQKLLRRECKRTSTTEKDYNLVKAQLKWWIIVKSCVFENLCPYPITAQTVHYFR